MPVIPYSIYDRLLYRTSKVLHLSPVFLRHANLALLVLLAVLVGVLLTRIFHRAARGRIGRWTGLLLEILSILPVPALLIAAIYFDLDVVSLTVHSFSVHLLQRTANALTIGLSYYVPTRVAVLFSRRWAQQRPGREKLTHLFAFLIEAAAVLIAVYTLLAAWHLAPLHEHFAERVLMSFAVFLVCYGAGKVVILYLTRVSERDPSFVRFTEPAIFISRTLFSIAAIMIVLDNLGVHLTAVWTTLGVGGIAVAMALQETLSNFFAGLYLLADRPIQVGDYVQLSSGEEGDVLRIGWRSTSIRSLARNLVVVPNSTMAKDVVTNFSRPERELLLPIEVGVAYGTDPRRVCRILTEMIEEAIRDGVAGVSSEGHPAIRFMPGFGDSSLNFTLMVRITNYAKQFEVQTELRIRIVERFNAEGIEFPFPTRTLVFDKSVAQAFGIGERNGAGEQAVPSQRV